MTPGSSELSLVRPVFIVGAEDEVKVTERCREVVRECHVMEVVMVSAGPQREDVLQGPRKV